MLPLRIFIGYDSAEPVAYHVLSHSILRRASVPVSITPLVRSGLKGVYTRQRGPTESTEFSLTRFLVPYLCGFQGYAIFMDSDQLMRTDIAEVFRETPDLEEKALYVCQHDYTPKHRTKFLGHAQTTYPKKNWSSFMVFNAARCTTLTPDYVNTATGLDLHRFHWTVDEQIGALPLDWNWLVGEYEPNHFARNLHFTLGGPWFNDDGELPSMEEYLWSLEYEHLQRCAQQLSEVS